MSEYPSTPHYGANYGGQNQQNPPYLPPTYPNQYPQTDEGHIGQLQYAPSYDANISSYGYNGAVPGFSAAALAPGAPPLPLYQGWNQDPVPLPVYNAPLNNMQHSGYAVHPYDRYPQQYPPATSQSNYHQHISPTKQFDEGEVSEGEFDNGHAPSNSATMDYASAQYAGNGGNGYIDTAHRAVYARSQDPPPPQVHRPSNEYNYSREPPQSARQQSGSYSPYVAPLRDDGRDTRATRTEHYNISRSSHLPEIYTNGTAQLHNQSPWEQSQGMTTSRASSRANKSSSLVSPDEVSTKVPSVLATASSLQGTTPVVLQDTPLRATSKYAPVVSGPPLAQQASTIVYDKGELRKKAEGAILNLLPHDIRFEKYMEEGIAEDVVGSLFDNLRVSRTSSKLPNDVSQNQAPGQPKGLDLPAPFESNTAAEVQRHGRLLSTTTSPPPLTDKSNQMSTTNGNPTPNIPNQFLPSGTTEKEKTLKLKMEALKRSREERAQKAAAKSISKTSALSQAAQVAKLEKAEVAPVTNPSNSPSTLPSPHPNSHQPQLQVVGPPSHLPHSTPQTPAIPGLFLASAAPTPNPTSTTNVIPSDTHVNPRKRPVAADFDTPPAATPFKRPFGHSHSDTSLVIDVSEDEVDSDDGDIAMDLDSQADQDSPIQAARKTPEQRITANLPMLTNFSARKPFTPPPASSAASTPPIFPLVRKATLGRPEVLQEKEMQIEELRRKIAEAEAAKAQKRAQQSASGTNTPRSITTSSEHKTPVDNSMAKKVETSLQIQNMIDIAEEKVNSHQKRLVEAEAIKQVKAADLKQQEAERKRLRREKIATDLPRVDAEVVEKQRKLEQLKAQMAEIEAEVQRNLEDKQRMAEEMERLGQEAEDQLQAQRAKLKDLTGVDTRMTFLPARPASLPATDTENVTHSDPGEDQVQSAPIISSGVNGGTKHSEAIYTDSGATIPIRTDYQVINSNGPRDVLQHPPDQSDLDPGENKDCVQADQDPEAALQEAVRVDTDSRDQQRDGNAMDIEDSYAPDPDQLAPISTPGAKEDAERSPSYSPVLERNVPNISDRRSEGDYEPPEAGPSAERTPTQSPPFSPAPAEPMTEDIDDLVIFPSNPGQPAADANESVELSLPQMNGSVSMLIEGVQADKFDQVQSFTPYESPLKSFRAFRFHPSFNQDVAGGFRSLTYSHKINPNVELCPWEMAGGTCNDKTCEFQHLRDIGLPDDAVLSSLGSPEEFTGDQRKQFCDGLKEVLSGLRARKIRDFDIIAKEVVAHRARFFGDSSKVLMLEGTSI